MNNLSRPNATQLTAMLILLLASLSVSASTILIHGDSLSAGYGLQQGEEWPALLQNKLSQNGLDYTIVNTSISGETTNGGLARFVSTFEQYQPALVILALGANDGLRGQPLGQTEENLAAMIRHSQKNDAQVLLLGIRIPPNYGSRYSNAFHQMYFSLQQTFDIPLLPFMLEGVAGHDELMQIDGLHPEADAQPIIMANVWQSLKPLLRNQP